MNVPLSWLKELVPIEAEAAAIADKLTFSGIEVEGIHRVGATYEGLVGAEVRAVRPHPNADRLTLCTVFDGAAELTVVCGAPNVRAGMCVALAPVGSVLPDGQRMKAAKIRGEASAGMLCAEDELGLSDKHDGIVELPAGTVAGTPLVEVLGGPDTVLELEITWNRPDCLSMTGIAREVAALFGVPVRRPAVTQADAAGAEAAGAPAVTIEAPALCNRYTARCLENVRIGPSPLWMRRRLELCGIRPISNIVDVTNYVLLESGHPLHAFDAELLQGDITVREAREGERIETLDGEDRPLEAGMLVIADAAGPVALAGVMGGARTEIRPETTRVVLESAHFAPPSIHATAAHLKLGSESSRRFERGVNVMTVDVASARAVALMGELAGARPCGALVDEFPVRPEPRRIALDYGRMNALLGTAPAPETVVSIFESLEIPVVDQDPMGCTVKVPDFRHDLELEADLVEEVARLYGLEHIPDVLPAARVAPGSRHDEAFRAQARCREILIGLGLTETMTYSFLSPVLLDAVDPGDAEARVALPNPVSADHAMLRPSLVPQMVDTLGRNMARQTTDMAAFELGRVFRAAGTGALVESTRLTVGLLGAAGAPTTVGCRPPDAAAQFLRIKGVIEALCEAVHCEGVEWIPTRRDWLEDGFGAELRLDGACLGAAGVLSLATAHKRRITDAAAVAELEAAPLLRRAFAFDGLRPVSAYPAVARDVALVIDESVPHAEVVRVIRAAAPPELTAVTLFDIFSGEGIGHGKRSLAYTLVYQSHERTLTDADVNRYHESVREALAAMPGADLR